jgi:hypothetical protein
MADRPITDYHPLTDYHPRNLCFGEQPLAERRQLGSRPTVATEHRSVGIGQLEFVGVRRRDGDRQSLGRYGAFIGGRKLQSDE